MSLPVPPPYPPAYSPVAAPPAYPGEPTKDECTMALLAHLLQVFSGFIGPLVIFLVKPDSKFVKYHALQSLIWQTTYMILGIGGMALFFFLMFATAAHAGPNVPHDAMPSAFAFLFPLVWLFWLGGWVVNLILGIVYGIKANRGEWAGYPLIGRILLREYNPAALSHPSAPRV